MDFWVVGEEERGLRASGQPTFVDHAFMINQIGLGYWKFASV